MAKNLVLSLIFCLSSVLMSSGIDFENIKHWDMKSCSLANQLFRTKEHVTKKLKAVLVLEKEKKSLSNSQVKAINIYQAELNDTEIAVFEAMGGLRKLLHEDYKSVVNIKEAIKQRLTSFQDIALRQEDQFNAISEAEKELTAENKHHGGNETSLIGKLIEGVLNGISFAADKLEEKLDEKSFEKTRKAKGASIEAVVRVNEEAQQGEESVDAMGKNDSPAEHDKKEGMSILVDSQNNQFVLSKSKDATVPHEDLHLIKDIIWIVVISFIGACGCTVVQFPTMFGFILSGMILGPTCMNVIKSVVQVETLGEFGVFFILFSVGLEFSPERIRKVWKVSAGGSSLMMILIIIFGMFGGTCFGMLPQQSAFVAACLSLSSTPLIVKFLDNRNGELTTKEHTNGGHDYSSSLLGILVMQDVYLGLIVAILPALSGHMVTASPKVANKGVVHNFLHGNDHSNSTSMAEEFVNASWIIFEVLGSMVGLFVFCILIARYAIGPFYRCLQKLKSLELLFLGTVAVAFFMLMVTEHLGISMELGCFVAGVVISANGEQTAKQVVHLVEPIKDFLSCLFFASIGLHVFPSFVLNELSVTLTLTLGVVVLKFVVGVFVLRLFLPKSTNSRYIVAAGLAQVSEFSFVLGSRARRFHLISREVYLLILSVTTLSLLFAPLVWRASLWKFGDKRGPKATSPPVSPRTPRAV